jgi:hypothetical protein
MRWTRRSRGGMALPSGLLRPNRCCSHAPTARREASASARAAGRPRRGPPLRHAGVRRAFFARWGGRADQLAPTHGCLCPTAGDASRRSLTSLPRSASAVTCVGQVVCLRGAAWLRGGLAANGRQGSRGGARTRGRAFGAKRVRSTPRGAAKKRAGGRSGISATNQDGGATRDWGCR